MKVLIVGFGSIGRRHLKNIKSVEPNARIILWRHQKTPDTVGADSELVDKVVYTLDDAVSEKPEAAFITNPASLHVQTATVLAENHINLFIEKPISNTIDGVDNLINICEARRLTLMVGYNFRFYRPLEIVKTSLEDNCIGRPLAFRAEAGQYLPDWRPNSDYRIGVSARKQLGGGVLLELSHEFDYARWLLGEIKEVSAFVDHQSSLEIDVEDTAVINLRFVNGVVGNIHLDMIQRTPRRGCHIIGSHGTLEWDYISHKVTMYSSENNSWLDLTPPSYTDRNLMYKAEINHFFECVKTGSPPLVNAIDGLRALQIALAIKKSSETKQVIEI